jgi:ABC-type xylose transport system substrate-binding protein
MTLPKDDNSALERLLADNDRMAAEIERLQRAVENAQAEANAWKHANAFEPVTAEELDVVLMDADRAGRLIEILGPLYRQRKA